MSENGKIRQVQVVYSFAVRGFFLMSIISKLPAVILLEELYLLLPNLHSSQNYQILLYDLHL